MEYLLFDPPAYERMYSCANFNINAVPLAERQRPFLGAAAILMFVIFEIAYIPCIIAIWRHLDNSCYKLMFVLALVDIPCLSMLSLPTGVFGMLGLVYCSSPMLIYTLGMLANFFWSIGTCAVVLLALNRCLDVAMPQLCHTLFHGHRTWLYFVPILAYSVYYGFFTKSILWSSVGFFWTYDPYYGYPQGGNDQYTNVVDQLHCGTIAFLLPAIYFAFFVLFKLKNGHIAGTSSGAHYKWLFIQSLLICGCTTTTGLAYSIFYVKDPGPVLSIFFCTFAWIFTHGMPSIVYLALNKTLRNEVRAMWRAGVQRLRREKPSIATKQQKVITVRKQTLSTVQVATTTNSGYSSNRRSAQIVVAADHRWIAGS